MKLVMSILGGAVGRNYPVGNSEYYKCNARITGIYQIRIDLYLVTRCKMLSPRINCFLFETLV
jgi:hypothetical protein